MDPPNQQSQHGAAHTRTETALTETAVGTRAQDAILADPRSWSSGPAVSALGLLISGGAHGERAEKA